jgi:hypothetical protein
MAQTPVTTRVRILTAGFLAATSVALPFAATAGLHAQATPPATIPIPSDYREWIYLSSGMDMTYNTPAGAGLGQEHGSVFDNVFVNPEAYRAFKRSGTWPDNATFILENRAGEGAVSINKAGKTQGLAVTGLEIHQKRNDVWAFYVRNKDGTEHLVPRPASCYTCHEAHGAVDTTFTQFYPTLLPIAQDKKTLSPAYLQESAAASAPAATTPPAP